MKLALQEAVPVNKQADAEVFAGTILENGTIQIRADRVGEDTTFAKLLNSWKKHKILNPKRNGSLIAF